MNKWLLIILLLLGVCSGLSAQTVAGGKKDVQLVDGRLFTPKFNFKEPYPNPANAEFVLDYNFTGANTAKIILFNVLGTKVLDQELNRSANRADFDVNGLTPGVYFYTINIDGANEITKRLIIRR